MLPLSFVIKLNTKSQTWQNIRKHPARMFILLYRQTWNWIRSIKPSTKLSQRGNCIFSGKNLRAILGKVCRASSKIYQNWRSTKHSLICQCWKIFKRLFFHREWKLFLQQDIQFFSENRLLSNYGLALRQ